MSNEGPNAQVYYRDRYWNDTPEGKRYLNRLISDRDEPFSLAEAIRARYPDRLPFRKALVLNCGNGWLERELYDAGIFSHAECFDYSEELLAEARAHTEGRHLTYHWNDCNAVIFPHDSFDLVINHAAMHHVQYIDRLHHVLCRALRSDGLYINFDYIGPHRNQYEREHFSLMNRVNSLLPLPVQKDLRYPHLETMLHTDPTEAIHSELIIPTFERYFIPLERKDFHGGVAYDIMHNNPALLDQSSTFAKECRDTIFDADCTLSTFGVTAPLFSFFVGRPRKSILSKQATLSRWRDQELSREERAAQNGGKYLTE